MSNIPFQFALLPELTDDTLLSINIYSDKPTVDTLLGNITVAENAAGKTIVVPDGANHNITSKAVYTTAGEVSLTTAAMNIDLSGAGAAGWASKDITITGVNYVSDLAGYNSRIVSDIAKSGVFTLKVDTPNNDFNNTMLGVDVDGTNTQAWGSWDYGVYISGTTIRAISGGNIITPDTPVTNATESPQLRRLADNHLHVYYQGASIHDFGVVSGNLFGHIAHGLAGKTLPNPQFI